MKRPKEIHLMNLDADNVQWAEGQGDLKDEVNYIRSDIAKAEIKELKAENKELRAKDRIRKMDTHKFSLRYRNKISELEAENKVLRERVSILIRANKSHYDEKN